MNRICQRATKIDNQSSSPPSAVRAPSNVQCTSIPSVRKQKQRRQTAAEAISHTDIKRQARNAPQSAEQCREREGRTNRRGEESFLSNSLSGWRLRITPRRTRRRRRRRGRRDGMALKIMNARFAFLFVRGVSPSLSVCHCPGG